MSLNNVCDISNMSISEKVEANLISFFDWGFTDKGGYINIDIDQSGAYVNNRSSLIKVTDVRGGVYWQGPENWVYENDVSNGTPNSPALVYNNGILDAGASINYRDGRVVLSSGNTTATSVKADFSYKWVTFTSSRKSNNVRRLQSRQTRTDIANGEIDIPPEIRVPLPCVTIDTPPITSSRPYGIFNRNSPKIYSHTNNVYIIGESASDVVRISDYICSQEGTTFRTFDPQLVRNSGDFPLNFDGTLNSGKNYDELCAGYPWANIEIMSAESIYSNYLGPNIYQASVRLKTEVVACVGC